MHAKVSLPREVAVGFIRAVALSCKPFAMGPLTRMLAVSTAALVMTTVSAVAANAPRLLPRVSDPIEAVEEALDLSGEQIERLREIRDDPPPDLDDPVELRMWRAELHERMRGVLTAAQRSKIDEAEAGRAQMLEVLEARRSGELWSPPSSSRRFIRVRRGGGRRGAVSAESSSLGRGGGFSRGGRGSGGFGRVGP